MRIHLAIISLMLLGALATGCHFSVGNQDIRVRPGTHVRSGAVENGDGEMERWDALDPEGDAVFAFIGGQF